MTGEEMKKQLFLYFLFFIAIVCGMQAQQMKLVQFAVNSGMQIASNEKHKLQLIAGQSSVGLISSNKYKAEIGLLNGSQSISGVNDNVASVNQFVEILPNPTSEKMIIKTNNVFGASNAAVYNLAGEMVKDLGTLNSDIADASYTADISGLINGTYTVILSNGSTTFVKKFIISR